MQREFRELSDRRSGLRPPQFTLRTALLLTASVAALIVVGMRLGAIPAFAGVIALLTILAHMVSTAIGSQLSRNRDLSLDDGDVPSEPRIRQPAAAHPSDFAPATQLSRKKALDRRPIFLAVGLGAGSSALLSCVALSFLMWPNVSMINVLFGAASAAVIGGMIGFWLGSLFQVARSALSEAQKEN